MTRRGKKYVDATRRYERDRVYPLDEAFDLVKSLASRNFDETVEATFRLGIDPRKADQMIRGTVSLPHGTGKEVRVAAFAAGDAARKAREAGADLVGGEDLVQEVTGGKIEFDAAVATPDMMPVVGKAGRVLGPRGLMPNPKAGTVTEDIAKAVQEIKAGKLEYRVDRQANLHLIIGKRSFDEAKLVQNYLAIVDEILRAKPAAAKGRYIRSVTISTTMGPGIRIDPARIRDVEAAA
jgi:large subunit ribosomal protein L1